MRKSTWVFLFTTSFALGVAFRSLHDFGVAFSAFFVFLSLVIFAASFFTLKHSNILPSTTLLSTRVALESLDPRGEEALESRINQNVRMFVVVGVLMFAAGLGMIRVDIADLRGGDPALDARVGEEVVLRGVVADEADQRETHTKLTLRTQTHADLTQTGAENNDSEINTKVLLVTEHYPEFQYGDEVIVRGKIQKPENFPKNSDEPGRSFNYIEWLAKDGIYYQMFYPEIELVRGGQGSTVREALFSLKRSMLQNASRVLPEPHASLAGGITLGVKQALGADLLDAFRVTGIIHIVVLSGYNVTIIAEAFGRVAAFLPRLVGIGISALLICSFALMTGAGATIVRASMMALLVLFARATGRAYEITVALFVTGFVMVAWNPKILMHDPSFELSFLATLGLLQFAPRIERYFGWVPTRWKLREILTATLATQIFVLPLLLFMMGTISIVAPVVNLLILPFMPLAMFSSIAAMFLGFIHEAASLPLAYLSYVFLEYELAVVRLFAAFPFAHVVIKDFSGFFMFLAYVLLGIVFFTTSQRGKQVAKGSAPVVE